MNSHGIKVNEKECSRSVPIRNIPLHRQDLNRLSPWKRENPRTK